MNDTIEQLARSFRYQQAVTESKAAYNAYDGASRALDLARIRERAAELHSQSFQSLAANFPDTAVPTDAEREFALKLVRYAVNGRI